VGKGSGQFYYAMIAYLQQISDGLNRVESLRLDLKWCGQANGSDKFPITTSSESEKP
jgi:hypothetical protein